MVGRGNQSADAASLTPRAGTETGTSSLNEQLAQAIAQALAVNAAAVETALTLPPAKVEADVALPCQRFAKQLARNAVEIAAELAAAVSELAFVAEASALGPYLNVRFAPAKVAEDALALVHSGAEAVYGGTEGDGQTLVIDFSSPNAARKLGFHHLRGTVLGAALQRLYQARGYKVIAVNHLGDFGHNIGQLLYKLDQTGEGDQDELDAARLQQLYVEANAEEAHDPDRVKAEAKRWLSLLATDDPVARRRWQAIIESTKATLETTYERLGIHFDEYRGESLYAAKALEVAEQLLAAGVAERSDEGTVFVPGDENQGRQPIVLVTREGYSTYEARDIAAALDRKLSFGQQRSVYVTDIGQKQRFEAFLAATAGIDADAAAGGQHVGFGQMKVDGVKAKTSKGLARPLDEVLDEATARARDLVDGRVDDPDQAAEMIGVGAVVFGQLKMRRGADFEFDLEQAVSLKGETAPRLQYSVARINSICAKAGVSRQQALAGGDAALLRAPQEAKVAQALLALPEASAAAFAADDPSLIADALIALTDAWAAYQTAGARTEGVGLRVLADDPQLRAARLALAAATADALENGLALLGVRCPQRM